MNSAATAKRKMRKRPQQDKLAELERFVTLVREMRVQQTIYFEYRALTALDRAKKLEKQVDERIEGFRSGRLFEPIHH